MQVETLMAYANPVLGPDHVAYRARACGREREDGLWEAWLEFDDVVGEHATLRTPRETTQPNFTDAMYWATGVSVVYLQGALERAA